jgi:hypothetical protein
VPPALADQYIFRYKSGYVVAVNQPENPEDEDFDIRANFVGSPGESFSQNIPVKDNQAVAYWRLANGVLPQGISLDPAAGLLSGLPVRVQSTSFGVIGYTATGAEGTKAKITFSVVAPDERTVKEIVIRVTAGDYTTDWMLTTAP